MSRAAGGYRERRATLTLTRTLSLSLSLTYPQVGTASYEHTLMRPLLQQASPTPAIPIGRLALSPGLTEALGPPGARSQPGATSLRATLNGGATLSLLSTWLITASAIHRGW